LTRKQTLAILILLTLIAIWLLIKIVA